MNVYRDARRIAAGVVTGAVLVGAAIGYLFTDSLIRRRQAHR